MKKYLIANVKIPLDVLSDQSYLPLKEYITIDFTEADTLPEKPSAEYYDILENFQLLFNDKNEKLKEEPFSPFDAITSRALVVLKDEIAERTRELKLNSSFKQKKTFRNRHTKRIYTT